MNNKLLVGVIVVVLVICSFYIGNTINTRTVIQEKLGGLAGPDLMTDYFTFGGVMHYSQGGALKASTTLPVVCSLKSPAATSTLRTVQVNSSAGSSTAQTLYIGKGANEGATTTNLAAVTVGTSLRANVIGSSTLMTSANTLMSPNTWVVVGLEVYGANDSINGNCSAEWVLTRPL
jgi:hypothetical protein